MMEGNGPKSDRLLTALELEKLGVMRRGTLYKMVKAGKLSHYKVGCAGTGIRFKLDETLSSLRCLASERVTGSAVNPK